MTFIKEHWFKLTLSLVAVIVAFIVGFYFLYSLPKHNADLIAQQDAEQKAQEQEQRNREDLILARKRLYLSCLQTAEDNYSAHWDDTCSRNGLPEDCSLNLNLADRLNDELKESKDECETVYRISIEY